MHVHALCMLQCNSERTNLFSIFLKFIQIIHAEKHMRTWTMRKMLHLKKMHVAVFLKTNHHFGNVSEEGLQSTTTFTMPQNFKSSNTCQFIIIKKIE